MVCESQTIDDSNSPLAKDLRAIVKEKVLKGETDYQVYSFFRDRYGDYIILKPPFRPNTFILWFCSNSYYNLRLPNYFHQPKENI